MLPQILTQLGPEGLQHLKRLANNVVAGNNKLLSSVNEEEADDVPNLVGNFEEVAAQTEVENLEFNPWTTTADFRPLGSLNRARRLVFLLTWEWSRRRS